MGAPADHAAADHCAAVDGACAPGVPRCGVWRCGGVRAEGGAAEDGALGLAFELRWPRETGETRGETICVRSEAHVAVEHHVPEPPGRVCTLCVSAWLGAHSCIRRCSTVSCSAGMLMTLLYGASSSSL